MSSMLSYSAQHKVTPNFLEGRQRTLCKQEDTARSAQQVPEGGVLNDLSEGVLGRSTISGGPSQQA